MEALLLQVGQSASDRAVVAAGWLYVIAIAAVILIASAWTSRSYRR
jgi:hypothetical protein